MKNKIGIVVWLCAVTLLVVLERFNKNCSRCESGVIGSAHANHFS